MSFKQIRFAEEDPKIIVLSVKPASMGIRLVVILLLAVSVLGPLITCVNILISGDVIKFGGILFLVLFGFIAYYFLRILLWNSYGQEKISFTNQELCYEADYKWFKDGRKRLSLIGLKVRIVSFENGAKGRLLFESEGNQIQSVVQLEMEEANRLLLDVEERLKKTCRSRMLLGK
jgi:hypothetical protein